MIYQNFTFLRMNFGDITLNSKVTWKQNFPSSINDLDSYLTFTFVHLMCAKSILKIYTNIKVAEKWSKRLKCQKQYTWRQTNFKSE